MDFKEAVGILAQKIAVQILANNSDCEIQNIAFIDGKQKNNSPHTLYFGYNHQDLEPETLPKQCVLGLKGQTFSDTLFSLEGNLAIVENTQIFTAFNALNNIIDPSHNKSFYQTMLDKFTQTQDMTDLLNTAAAKMGQSLILLDLNFTILAYSTVFPMTDPTWTPHVKRGYCTYEFIMAITQLEAMKHSPNTTEPFDVTYGYLSPSHKLLSKLFHNGKLIGYLLLLENDTPITQIHFEMLRIVNSAVENAMIKYAPYLLNENTIYQQLLYNLLIGATAEDLAPYLSIPSLKHNFFLIVIMPKQLLSQKYLKETVSNKIKNTFPSVHCIVHDNKVIGLLPVDTRTHLPQLQLESLEQMAKEDALHIGISNFFEDYENTHQYYCQALIAIRLGQCFHQASTVYHYINYQFYDLLSNFNDKAQLAGFCHPALILLKQYDHCNNGDLWHTLNAYLTNGCSIKLAANALFIHRNSMSYRLDKIIELTKLDLEDPYTIFLLTMSYHIDHYCQQYS